MTASATNGEATALRRGRWFVHLIGRCIDEGAADLGEAVHAAELCLSLQPEPPEGVMLTTAEVEAPHKYSSTQFNLSEGGYSRSQGSPLPTIKEMSQRIDDEDLAEDGREDEPHITIKYGLHTDNADDVAKIVRGFGPIEIRFGKTFIFPGEEHDVVNVAVESDRLHQLNKLVSDHLECTDTHPKYIPHVCLAYVKSGKGKKYVGWDDVDGQKMLFTSIAFSSKTREHTEAHLSLADWSILLAHGSDIFNPRAQAILNRALKASANLTNRARRDLRTILDLRDIAAVAREVARWVGRYRLELAQLLTTTQISAVLEGAREVVKALPRVPPVGFPPPPPTMEPEQALTIVERLQGLPRAERETEIARLTPAEQAFVRQGMRHAILPAPVFEPRGETEGEEEFVFITNAARELSAKNVLTRPQYDRLEAAARQKAFAVAGVDAQQTLEKIRDTLSENVAEGADYETWRAKVLESVEEGTFLSEPHMEVVFRQNVQGAFSDGQIQVLQHPFVRGALPYAVYDAIDDDRVRHNHLALETLGIDGTNVYRVDDPVFLKFRPPWDWMDRCAWYAITVRQAAEKGVAEAVEWMRTGVEPSPPAFVRHPPFDVPEGFQRALQVAPLSVRLSMIALSDEHWITIGGHAEGGKKHVGGFPIRINKEGEILSGPAGLKGKKVSEIKEHFDKMRGKKKAEKSENPVDNSIASGNNASGGADTTPAPKPEGEKVEATQQQVAYKRLVGQMAEARLAGVEKHGANFGGVSQTLGAVFQIRSRPTVAKFGPHAGKEVVKVFYRPVVTGVAGTSDASGDGLIASRDTTAKEEWVPVSRLDTWKKNMNDLFGVDASKIDPYPVDESDEHELLSTSLVHDTLTSLAKSSKGGAK